MPLLLALSSSWRRRQNLVNQMPKSWREDESWKSRSSRCSDSQTKTSRKRTLAKTTRGSLETTMNHSGSITESRSNVLQSHAEATSVLLHVLEKLGSYSERLLQLHLLLPRLSMCSIQVCCVYPACLSFTTSALLVDSSLFMSFFVAFLTTVSLQRVKNTQWR